MRRALRGAIDAAAFDRGSHERKRFNDDVPTELFRYGKVKSTLPIFLGVCEPIFLFVVPIWHHTALSRLDGSFRASVHSG
jgi:hypothetical protein